MVTSAQGRQETEQRRLLSAAIEASDQIVMITGADHRIVYVNSAFARVTGYEPAEAIGRNPRFLQGAGTSQATRVGLREAIAKGQPAQAEILNYRKSGEPYWVDVSIVPVSVSAGGITHWIAIERDITQRKAQEQEITRLAMEDYLTGLPNRRAAETRLQVEWSRARRDRCSFAIALVDVDRFKLVNDQYGHQIGDQALVHVARLLFGNMRGGDWIARWGGEEFLVCFHDLDARGALTAGERARKLVRSKPVKLTQGDLPLTVSIGIALYGAESESLDSMLASADALLYQAKQSGRDKVLCAGVSAGRRGSLIWEGAQVQTALHEDRVVAAYQTIVDLRTGDVVGDEALRESSAPARHRFPRSASSSLRNSFIWSQRSTARCRDARWNAWRVQSPPAREPHASSISRRSSCPIPNRCRTCSGTRARSGWLATGVRTRW